MWEIKLFPKLIEAVAKEARIPQKWQVASWWLAGTVSALLPAAVLGMPMSLGGDQITGHEEATRDSFWTTLLCKCRASKIPSQSLSLLRL